MRRRLFALLLAVLSGGAQAATCPDVSVARWKGNARAAFLLAFDDGCTSQLTNAIPALIRYRIPGTFYLFPAAGYFKERRNDWVAAAKSPFVCLGNHTINHAGVRSPEEFEPSLLACQEELKALTPDAKWPRLVSFAQPGGVPWKISAEQVAATLARAHVVDRPPFHGPPFFCGTTDAAFALIDETIEKGGVEHLDFHGIGGDWLSTPTDYLVAVCRKLDERRDDIWPATAIDCHKYATERDAARLEDVVLSDDAVSFTLRTSLDASYYDLPLTVVVTVADWTTARLTVGAAAPTTVAVKDGKILVDVVSGVVKLEKIR